MGIRKSPNYALVGHELSPAQIQSLLHGLRATVSPDDKAVQINLDVFQDPPFRSPILSQLIDYTGVDFDHLIVDQVRKIVDQYNRQVGEPEGKPVRLTGIEIRYSPPHAKKSFVSSPHEDTGWIGGFATLYGETMRIYPEPDQERTPPLNQFVIFNAKDRPETINFSKSDGFIAPLLHAGPAGEGERLAIKFGATPETTLVNQR